MCFIIHFMFSLHCWPSACCGHLCVCVCGPFPQSYFIITYPSLCFSFIPTGLYLLCHVCQICNLTLCCLSVEEALCFGTWFIDLWFCADVTMRWTCVCVVVCGLNQMCTGSSALVQYAWYLTSRRPCTSLAIYDSNNFTLTLVSDEKCKRSYVDWYYLLLACFGHNHTNNFGYSQRCVLWHLIMLCRICIFV
jgi:hypothetical protein